jgi:hypothetical protein
VDLLVQAVLQVQQEVVQLVVAKLEVQEVAQVLLAEVQEVHLYNK